MADDSPLSARRKNQHPQVGKLQMHASHCAKALLEIDRPRLVDLELSLHNQAAMIGSMCELI